MDTLLVDRTQKKTAQQNMDYDAELVLKSEPGFGRLRWYEWPSPGITMSHRQRGCPQALQAEDVANRITGGGILFHSPGDLVFSIVGELAHPRWPNGLKEKLIGISEALRRALSDCGVQVEPNNQKRSQNLEFCHTYQSPYELWEENEKVVGMTLRRLRTRFIVQGIVHRMSNAHYFNVPSDWEPYLSTGLQRPPDIETLGKQLEQEVQAIARVVY